jgi:hypothetical protein
VGAFAWAGFIAIVTPLALMGGDGSASVPSKSHFALAYLGSLYLFLISLSCLGFVRGKLLTAMGVMIYLTFGVFASTVLRDGGVRGLILLSPFAGVGGAWVLLYRSKRATQDARTNSKTTD